MTASTHPDPPRTSPTRPAALLGEHVIVAPSGELHLKSKATRRRFMRLLQHHVEGVLRGVAPTAEVVQFGGRLHVLGGDSEQVALAASRVFGVHRVIRVLPILFDELADLAPQVGAATRHLTQGRRFAVRVKRRGKHGFSSTEANMAIAAEVFDGSAGVDLKRPDVTINVSIRQDVADLQLDRIDGPDGLPAGAQERCISLISGGFDSPVAAWMMMRRGCSVDFLHFKLECSQGEHTVVVAQELRRRWPSGPSPLFWMVDFQPAKEALLKHVDSKFRQVVLKQLMVRTADALAARLGVHALVTGEAVGQVSSQTLSHLAAIDQNCQRTILRPVSGLLKEEIIAWARRIGTEEASARAKEVCDLSDGPVSVTARWAKLAESNERLPDDLIDEALASLEVIALDDWLPGVRWVPVVSSAPDDVPVLAAGDAAESTGRVAFAGHGGARAATELQRRGGDPIVVLYPPTSSPPPTTPQQK